jgi:hypothetical protein
LVIIFRSSGVQEFRSSGVQEFRSSGVQEFRSSGVQEFKVRRIRKLQGRNAFCRVGAFSWQMLYSMAPELLNSCNS